MVVVGLVFEVGGFEFFLEEFLFWGAFFESFRGFSGF